MEQKKYISFEPWKGGYTNIVMSYEIAAAIAYITGRVLILPPNIFCLFLAEGNKANYFDIWKTLDKNAFKKEFNCVDYKDVPEYAALENDVQYYAKVNSIAKIITFGDEYKPETLDNQVGLADSKVVLVNEIANTEDFDKFSQGRQTVNLKFSDKFVHFPKNLFGHFFYHVYAGGPIHRNILKEKIKNGIKYRENFYQLAKTVKKRIGNYNAIHVRQNDFLKTRTHTASVQISTLLNDINDRISTNLPLYIATDEKNKSLFLELRKKYNIWFLHNFNLNLKDYEALIVEQIICSEAETFLGSRYSTYSEYINTLRGYKNKKDTHREGTNFNFGYLKYDRFPWEVDPYGWDRPFDTKWKYERSYFNLGFYGSHNAAVAISYKNTVLEIIELEKWLGLKNAAFHYCFPIENPIEVAREMYNYIKNKYNVYLFDNVLWNGSKNEGGAHCAFPALNYQYVPHHVAHACNVMYQSTAEKSLIISFDGGSEMGFFHIYLGEKGKDPVHIAELKNDLAVAYQTTAHYLDCIKQESVGHGNLVYSGKIMGLSSYGERNEELIEKYKTFYKTRNEDNIWSAHEIFLKVFNFDSKTRITGKQAQDLAKNNQIVFEELFKEMITPYIEKYGQDRELQFSGGGAMNILNNTIYDAFVSPNPDDRGLALGCLLYKIKPSKIIDSTYLGSLPYDTLPPHAPYSVDQITDDLINGQILGLIQGRLECSARALGNRSIICLPRPGMKDKLNQNVKRRESFRPFAPIVRLEDSRKYFEYGKHSRWMNHNAVVKPEWRNELASIVHIDNTARLQTITKEQNPFLYEVLTVLEAKQITPVLLNTSFNIQGKPILNTYTEALWMRENTGLDKVITEKFIFL